MQSTSLSHDTGGLATILAAGVDWLTLTTPRGSPVTDLYDVYATLKSKYESSGGTERAATLMQYVGVQSGSTFFGQSQQGALLQATGSTAHQLFLARPVGAGRPSRIDLAVTYTFGRDYETWDAVLAQRTRDKRGTERRKRYAKLGHEGYEAEGQTLYIGKRVSNAFGRVYDKARESPGDYELGTWRHEVQFKRDDARRALLRLEQAVDAPRAILDTVSGWFDYQGSPIPWTVPEIVPYETEKKTTPEAEKSLMWLKKHISPTVRRLIREGYESEVWRALLEPDSML